MSEPEKKVHPVDEFVGDKLKDRRKKLKLSQSALGELVSVSFQQIQKYERGLNRIPASKLYEFAEVMNTPITYFYDGISIDDSDLDIISDDTRLKFHRTEPLKILLVEHDPVDVARTQKAIESGTQKTEIHIEVNGLKAQQFLKSKSKINEFNNPDIIITALATPKIDGLSLLKEVKRDKDLKHIPVILLTNSLSYSDMLKCYKAQAAGFIGKTVDEQEFRDNVSIAISYWAKAVVLP